MVDQVDGKFPAASVSTETPQTETFACGIRNRPNRRRPPAYAEFIQKNQNRTVLLDLGVAPMHQCDLRAGGAAAVAGDLVLRDVRRAPAQHLEAKQCVGNQNGGRLVCPWDVTELYVDQYCIDPAGGCGTAPLKVRRSWDAFLHAADTAGIDLYLCVGEDAGAGIPETVSNVAAFRNRSAAATAGTCGPRLSRILCFVSGGKSKFPSIAEAAAGCAAVGDVLCTKAELKGHEGCEIGWCNDWEGFWMRQASKDCGSAGYSAWTSSKPAGPGVASPSSND